MMLERQRFAKYSCKDIFRILLACETLVNNQLDLSHSCLLYRENNSWGGEKPLQMFTKCLHTASNLLCTSKHRLCDTTKAKLVRCAPETFKGLGLYQQSVSCPQKAMLAGIVVF